MSILNVEKLTHGFGEEPSSMMSFRLIKDTSGLVGANGEEINLHEYRNRSITTRRRKIEWSKNVRLDTWTTYGAEPGMTVRGVFKSFRRFIRGKRVSMVYMAMGDANEEEMNAMLEEVSELQERLNSRLL